MFDTVRSMMEYQVKTKNLIQLPMAPRVQAYIDLCAGGMGDNSCKDIIA